MLVNVVMAYFLTAPRILDILVLGYFGAHTFIFPGQSLLRHYNYCKLPMIPWPSQLFYAGVSTGL